MGLLSSIGTVASVAADVSSGVFSLGKGVVSAGLTAGKGVIGFVSKVSKSLLGKFAIGAGAVGILSSIKPNGSDESLLSKIGSGFKSFINSMTSSVASKASGVASGAALGVAATATQVGTAVSKAEKDVASSEKTVGLRDAIITSAPLSFGDSEPAKKPPCSDEPASEAQDEPDVQPAGDGIELA